MTPASLLPALASGARILVVRLRSIGDIVLLTPALHLVKQWRPDLRVSVAVESRFRELLKGNPDVEEVLDPGEGAGWRKAASRLRAVRELRRRKFSLCLNLHGGPASTLLTRGSGARWKAGFAHFRGRSAYHFLIPDARTVLGKPKVHTAEHQASAFFHLGLPRREVPRAKLCVQSGWKAWWEGKRASLGVSPDRPYAILHPTALYATKRWAPENFARLGAYLEGNRGLVPIYSCGPGESGGLEAVETASAPRGGMRRVEGASLGEFMAALSGSRLFVGNDSGPAHMAVALGRPSVVIFGSSSSEIWGPWPRPQLSADGQNPDQPGVGESATGFARVVQTFYECNPCPGDRCYRFERPECILSVGFDQVRSAVDDVLAQSAASKR